VLGSVLQNSLLASRTLIIRQGKLLVYNSGFPDDIQKDGSVNTDQTVYQAYLASEIGTLAIAGTEDYITSVEFVEPNQGYSNGIRAEIPQAVRDCINQFEEYFNGDRREFSVRLEPEGTEFQKRVWRQLSTIPYGTTTTYLDIAKAVGNEKAVRAVGAANGQNPISIIVPCHRVIGSDGKLTGYGGGLWRKEWLLKHEGGLHGQQLTLF
jgi:methylated-DNA-[protein]-cysteine S-methyltransferase